MSAWYGWLCRISIYREAMTDRSAWDRYSTESKSWEHLCVIIGLQDGTDLRYGVDVLVLGSNGMERVWHCLQAIGSREINCHCKRDLSATAQVVNETWNFK